MKSCLTAGLPKRFFCLLNKANVLYKQEMRKKKKNGQSQLEKKWKNQNAWKTQLSNLKSGFCDTCNTHQAWDIKLNTLRRLKRKFPTNPWLHCPCTYPMNHICLTKKFPDNVSFWSCFLPQYHTFCLFPHYFRERLLQKSHDCFKFDQLYICGVLTSAYSAAALGARPQNQRDGESGSLRGEIFKYDAVDLFRTQ